MAAANHDDVEVIHQSSTWNSVTPARPSGTR
jgi:hypothetical protein